MINGRRVVVVVVVVKDVVVWWLSHHGDESHATSPSLMLAYYFLRVEGILHFTPWEFVSGLSRASVFCHRFITYLLRFFFNVLRYTGGYAHDWKCT